jgi:hypothetical protein
MNEQIKSLAVNFFAPSLATPEVFRYDTDEKPGTVKEIKLLGHPSYYSVSIGGECSTWTWERMLTDIRVKVGQEVKPEEIIGMHRGHLTHHLDAVRKYHFSSDVERAELLLEIIKQWAGKPITLFCNGGGALRYFDWNEWTSNSQADETPLGWKDPSNCNSCGITQEVLRAIFG